MDRYKGHFSSYSHTEYNYLILFELDVTFQQNL